ncbi:MAG TPA: SDR family oxidoreductase [Chthoniobacteraceae bacterium]|nr:SDR family oxidoreductase [Chthoniobacteraceae bacterium]
MTETSSTQAPLVLVTGAAGIIGPGILKELQDAGWRTAAAERGPEAIELYEKAFGKPLAAEHVFFADLSSQEECRRLVCEVEAKLGPIAGIVHGAAWNSRTPVSEITEETALTLFKINFFALLWLTQAALPSLEQQKGSVVSLSSVLMNEPAYNNLLYAASKAALEKANEVLAGECYEKGVRFNTIRVGRIPGVAFLMEGVKELPPDEAREMVAELLPRWVNLLRERVGEAGAGTPQDIGQTVCFLMSPQARFISGHTITLDGAYSRVPRGAGSGARADLYQEWKARRAEKKGA